MANNSQSITIGSWLMAFGPQWLMAIGLWLSHGSWLVANG
jgi:hypothetical protein